MSEFTPSESTNESRTPQLLVAMRSIDRRSFVSPTTMAPDFFTFDDSHADKRLGVESRVAGMMRAHEGVFVNSDHALRTPDDAREYTGYAVYLRGVADYEKASHHGHFSAHDVRDMRHDLLELVADVGNTPPEERRIHRIKAELFQQVINLFEGKSIDAPRRRS